MTTEVTEVQTEQKQGGVYVWRLHLRSPSKVLSQRHGRTFSLHGIPGWKHSSIISKVHLDESSRIPSAEHPLEILPPALGNPVMQSLLWTQRS